MSTVDWLHSSLIVSDKAAAVQLDRCGHTWNHVAGFSSCGSVFAIYQSGDRYCVHAGDTWPEDSEPSMGYFDGGLRWDVLINAVAAKYDAIRAQRS